MIVNLKFLNGNSKEITLIPGQTIQDIKITHLNLNLSNLDEIKIIFSGKILNNNQIVDDLGITDKSFFVILTTTKSALESLTAKNEEHENDSNDTLSSDSDNEIINGDLFSMYTSKGSEDDKQEEEEEEEEEIDYNEVINKNNSKFLELSQDPEFTTLINIVLNKPEYLNYALKFVQSGMIFNRPNEDSSSEQSTKNYSTQFEKLKNLNIVDDVNKISKALEISNGDIQMAIRYIYMSNFDENYVL